MARQLRRSQPVLRLRLVFFAQDEIQVAEHPVLGSLREALIADGQPSTTRENGRPTPVLVMGAERRVSIATAPGAGNGGPSWLYGGKALAAASAAAIRQATTRIDPPTISNILAIAAPYGGHGRYQREEIGVALSTAYSGFRAALLESRRSAGADALVVIHSGFWGCGAFGGNRVPMILLQVLAAQMAGVTRLVFHVGDPIGRTSVESAIRLERELADATTPVELIGRVAGLELAWGAGAGS